MGKLHFKETPEERAERRWRKAKRAERKARKHRRQAESSSAAWDSGGIGEEEEEAWVPPPSSSKIDLDKIRAEIEERRFREKLFDAMEEDYDARLDAIETTMNDYAHIPGRWKTSSSTSHGHDADGNADPNLMTDEEYAEWIREGMWRKTHRAEMEERDRRKAEREARKARERKAREETKRLEREREAERALRREAKDKYRRLEAWEYYESRWKICSLPGQPDKPFTFRDIPWPVFAVPRATESLSAERISAFLFEGVNGNEPKSRRERVREALLRWHPDKFEGKLGAKLDAKEKEMILEGVGVVARCLNDMMAAIST